MRLISLDLPAKLKSSRRSRELAANATSPLLPASSQFVVESRAGNAYTPVLHEFHCVTHPFGSTRAHKARDLKEHQQYRACEHYALCMATSCIKAAGFGFVL